jgi:FeS assembly protein SufD
MANTPQTQAENVWNNHTWSEDFYYTPLRGVHFLQSPLHTKQPKAPLGYTFDPNTCWMHLVCVDGEIHPVLSHIPEGVAVTTTQQPFEKEELASHPLRAANIMQRPVFWKITVPPRTHSVLPVVVEHVSSSSKPVGMYPHLIWEIGSESSLTVVEWHPALHEGSTFNQVGQWLLQPHAHVTHVTHTVSNNPSHFFKNTFVEVQKAGSYTHVALSEGHNTCRHDVRVFLQQQDACAHLYGASLSHTRQHQDIHWVVNHNASHTQSTQHLKQVSAHHASSSFTGNIHVAPHAQKIQAHQQSKALLLHPQASACTRPQLEISANDVQCSHGASIGSLDANALFYLKSRGLSHEEASHMLVEAFVRDVFSVLPEQGVRERLEQHTTAWMDTHKVASP